MSRLDIPLIGLLCGLVARAAGEGWRSCAQDALRSAEVPVRAVTECCAIPPPSSSQTFPSWQVIGHPGSMLPGMGLHMRGETSKVTDRPEGCVLAGPLDRFWNSTELACPESYVFISNRKQEVAAGSTEFKNTAMPAISDQEVTARLPPDSPRQVTGCWHAAAENLESPRLCATQSPVGCALGCLPSASGPGQLPFTG